MKSPQQTIQEKSAALSALNEEVKSLLAKAEAGDYSAETSEEIEKKTAKIKSLHDEILAARAELEKKDAAKKFIEEMNDLYKPAAGTGAVSDPANNASNDKKNLLSGTVSDQVFGSANFKSWWSGLIGGHGEVSNSTHVQSPRVEMKSLLTFDPPANVGAFNVTQRSPLVESLTTARELRLFDLISRNTMQSEILEILVEKNFINNAAVVPEATNINDPLAVKPYSSFQFVTISETAKMIAHMVAITKRAMSDEFQMRSYIDNNLRYGLVEKLQQQILNGDGTGTNFRGLFFTPGTMAYTYNADLIVSARRALTLVTENGYTRPNAYLMHPSHWERIELSKNDIGDYVVGNIQGTATPTLWGVPVVTDSSMPLDKVICGNFRYAELWDRMQTTISFSDSHADFFQKNLVAILAEQSAAFVVRRPTAFCIIDSIP
jgi:HK97 family phage major capsid protein